MTSPGREASPAKPGDFFEFFAETDILCALSTCPGGDPSAWGWAASEEMRNSCRPLGVEVYGITDPAILENWEPLPSACILQGAAWHQASHV